MPATLVVDSTGTAETPALPPFLVKITELSVGGLGIQSAAPLDLNAVYHDKAFDSLLPCGTRVKIVSSRTIEGGGFEIGAELV